MIFLSPEQRSCLQRLEKTGVILCDTFSEHDSSVFDFLVQSKLAEYGFDFVDVPNHPTGGGIRPVWVTITENGRSCLSEHFYNDKKFIVPTVISVISLILAIISLLS